MELDLVLTRGGIMSTVFNTPTIKHLAYMCNKCYNNNEVDVGINFVGDYTPTEFFINENIINYTCHYCKEYTTHFMVDADIAETLSLLNKMGYKTIFSCQGHCTARYTGIKGNPYKLKHGDTYVFIKGKKKPDPELVMELIKIGFTKWSIGQNKTFRRIDITNPDDVVELLNSTEFCFHYDFYNVYKRIKYLSNKTKYDWEINYNAAKYFKNINKKLLRVVKKFYKEVNNGKTSI